MSKLFKKVIIRYLKEVRKKYEHEHDSLTMYLSYPNKIQEDDSENVETLMSYRTKISLLDELIDDLKNL